jgi:uncharacterized protein (UPF0147 family)
MRYHDFTQHQINAAQGTGGLRGLKILQKLAVDETVTEEIRRAAACASFVFNTGKGTPPGNQFLLTADDAKIATLLEEMISQHAFENEVAAFHFLSDHFAVEDGIST